VEFSVSLSESAEVGFLEILRGRGREEEEGGGGGGEGMRCYANDPLGWMMKIAAIISALRFNQDSWKWNRPTSLCK